MAYSVLIKLWALLPKWLLIASVACFFAYFTGVSHGQAPYELAAKISEVEVRHETKIIKQIIDRTNLEERMLNENLKNHVCIIDDSVARQLSDGSTN